MGYTICLELYAVTFTVTAPDLPIYMRATTNPGGRGHHWVKKMFIDPAPYKEPYDATDIETGEVLRYPAGHAKAGNLYSKEDLYLQDYQTIHILQSKVITKPCFYHYQNNNEGNYWMVIGILKKVLLLLSLIEHSRC
jgi:hypothetical protein